MSQVRVYLTAAKADADPMFAAIEAALEEEGWPVAIAETGEDSGLFEVSVYVEADQAGAARAAIAGCLGADAATLDFGIEELGDIDWVARSLEGLTAVEAGRFMVHGSHQRGAVRAGTIGIEIEAGQAFGTGHHGTTSGCLIALDRLIARRKPAISLDLGAGSAVLAIAIAKLARMPVLATDIDPVATRVAAENARLNGVHALVRCETATGFGHRAFAEAGPFDLIVANILARPLMAMAPDIARHLAPGGDVVLSGILAEQRWKVLAAFRQVGLHHRRTIAREGWVTLHLR
ncbi:MAG: 50S ribosomal protein L11 methyltransferase [Phyllobacteriaceae bacterium]|jgi:ribosomal protein L11 methyltransferase|nr:50S ribosomal protein L11 methyltransferase [Phyllobacteriaceae bacterium]